MRIKLSWPPGNATIPQGGRMARLDHIAISVRDARRARDWYTTYIGFAVEFESPDGNVVGLQDDAGLTLILTRTEGPVAASAGLMFSIQVAEVEATYRELAGRGVAFVHEPTKVAWGSIPITWR
jgi:catechol 2,3-dioxygenase-like lactoylglutathione lyase family enzyme